MLQPSKQARFVVGNVAMSYRHEILLVGHRCTRWIAAFFSTDELPGVEAQPNQQAKSHMTHVQFNLVWIASGLAPPHRS